MLKKIFILLLFIFLSGCSQEKKTEIESSGNQQKEQTTTEKNTVKQQPVTQGRYWVNASGKIHNSSCQWFGNTKSGMYSNDPCVGSNNDCRVCGGTGECPG